jgi:outer membrane immunogenic protein
LESENATVLPGTGVSDFVGASLKPQIQTGRVSLNYRFGDGTADPVDNSVPPVVGNWTGAYLGFGAGYGTATNDITLADRSPVPGSIFNVDIDETRAGSFQARLVMTIRRAPELSSAPLPTPTYPICTIPPV